MVMPEQTFYMKVLTQDVFWISTKYSYNFSCFFSLRGLWDFVTNGFRFGKLTFIFTIGVSATLILGKILLRNVSFGVKSTSVFKWQELSN